MEILNIEENLFANIEFNSKQKEIMLPPLFDSFVEKICKILNITIDSNSSLDFTYKDDEDEIINMNSDDDYQILLDQVKETNLETIIFIKLKDNPNMDINACTQNFIKFKEEKINKKEVNKINDDSKNIDNSNINILNTEKDNFIILNVKDDNKNNKDNNDINKINETINNNIDFSQTFITFLETCDLCYKYPIINILYYCLKCSVFICDSCERDPDIKHRHSIIKVQTKEQYIDLNKKIINSTNDTKSKFNIIFNGIKNSLKMNPIKVPQYMNIIQIARTRYNLEKIDNNKLKDALIKVNGDIDKAIILLQK